MLIVGVGDIGCQVARSPAAWTLVVEGVDIVPRQKDVLYVRAEGGAQRAGGDRPAA